jgi:outer membrane biosynthesis protein TonB
MPRAKKTADAGSKKSIADVAHPGTSAPSDTSKSIITPRPMIKDPMVVEENAPAESGEKPLAKKNEPKLTPPETSAAEKTEKPAEPEKPEEKPEPQPDPKPEPDPEPEPETKPEETAPEAPAEEKEDGKDKKKSPQADSDAEKAALKARDAKVQKLIESKKYFLPINAVEHRKSRRFVALGVVLAILLVLVWVDIALDAGLIDLGGVKPVTHFF